MVAAGAAAAALPLASRRSSAQQASSPLSLDTTSSTAQARQQQAFNIRVQAATNQAQQPLPDHTNNGDEDLYPNKIGSFTKGLPHNNLGEVDLGGLPGLPERAGERQAGRF